jgi:hypothetical protein
MKEELSQKKLHPKNLALNIVIIIIGGLVIFFGYSFINNTFFQTRIDPHVAQKSSSTIQGRVIQLDILNGCGIPGVAQKFTEYLRKKGFDVVQSSNNSSFDVEFTHVLDRVGDKETARKVALVLGIDTSKILVDINHEYYLNVSVVVGKDYQTLKPLK